MSNRTVVGGISVVAAVLVLMQLLAMFQMASPAIVMGGHMAGGFISAVAVCLIVASMWGTFAVLVAAAVLLLGQEDPHAHAR